MENWGVISLEPQPALSGILARNGGWLPLFDRHDTEREHQRPEGINCVLGLA